MAKNQLPIEQIDVSHCLRAEFTQSIIQSLINKRLSINLIGEKGTVEKDHYKMRVSIFENWVKEFGEVV